MEPTLRGLQSMLPEQPALPEPVVVVAEVLPVPVVVVAGALPVPVDIHAPVVPGLHPALIAHGSCDGVTPHDIHWYLVPALFVQEAGPVAGVGDCADAVGTDTIAYAHKSSMPNTKMNVGLEMLCKNDFIQNNLE